jgi:5-methyltetrahydrofolate--homocysteine methyltransferase
LSDPVFEVPFPPRPTDVDERTALLLATLDTRILVLDGATGTALQGVTLTADDFGGPELEGCNEILVLTRPDVIADLHSQFFEVGVDVVETCTFGAFGPPLAEYDIADKAHEINLRAAQIAREVADRYSTPDKPRFVAGSMGPGTKSPTLGQITFDELVEMYEIQVDGLLEGGVDLLIMETHFDLLCVKASVIAARRSMARLGIEVPIQIQVTMETTGRMLLGSEIAAALTTIDALRPDIIGINCATGPAEMSEHLRYLSQHSRIPISCLPNAGMPSVVDGKMHYDLTPDQLAEYHQRHVSDLGINIIGGCCGTTPAHLKAVVDACAELEVVPRTPEFEPSASSIYSAVPFHQDASFLIIGERTNANGSKKFREAMLEADWDLCVQMAKDQVKEGAHVLDVCVDYVGRDGALDMDEIAQRFATQSSAPLVLDSTEP